MTRNLPAPVNQFNRLNHVSGPEPTGTYTLGSRWNCTHAGQVWDSRNCTAASGAMLIDADSGGKIYASPCAIRNHQNDWSGGIGWDDVNVSLWDLFGERLTIPPSADWNDVIAWLKEGRAVGIQYDYDQLPYAYQAQKGGTFDHASILAGFRVSDSKVLFYDTLAKHAVWVPQSALRGACEKLALVQRGTRSRLFVMVTRPMPLVIPTVPPVTYRYGGEPKNRGRYLARRTVTVRTRPDPAAPQAGMLAFRDSFAARQSVNGKWLGNADGRKWVWKEAMWFQQSHIQGDEDVE